MVSLTIEITGNLRTSRQIRTSEYIQETISNLMWSTFFLIYSYRVGWNFIVIPTRTNLTQ